MESGDTNSYNDAESDNELETNLDVIGLYARKCNLLRSKAFTQFGKFYGHTCISNEEN